MADKRRGAGDKLGTCTFDRDRRESPDTFPWDRFPFSEDEPETTAGPDHMACGFDLAGQPFFLQPTHVRLPQ